MRWGCVLFPQNGLPELCRNYFSKMKITPAIESEFYFSKVYVIESLPAGERKTGTNIFNDIIERRTWQNPDLKAELLAPQTRAEFVQSLEKIRHEVEEGEALPFIHFEIHGFPDGFSLASGEDFTWKELYPHLKMLNFLTRNNLFVSLATCFGAHIFSVVNPLQTAPFYGYVGTWERVGDRDLEADFTEFFNEMLSSLSMTKAIKRLNQSAGAATNRYTVFHAEGLFDLIYDERYMKQVMTAEGFERRVDEFFVATMKRTPDYFLRLSIPEIRAAIRRSFFKMQDPLRLMVRQVFLIKDLPAEGINSIYNEMETALRAGRKEAAAVPPFLPDGS